MSWLLVAYIFFCIVVGLGSFMQLLNSGRLLAAILSLILFILIFVFFGLRWFPGGNSVFSYSGPWPPLINTCPDYLVYFKNGEKDTCIDMLGVSRNGNLKSWNKEDNPRNPPQDPNKYFPYTYKSGMTMDQLNTLCQATNAAGLTWEGITNGESCYAFSSQTTVVAADGTVTKCAPPPAS